jgi:general secretion pathway protein M
MEPNPLDDAPARQRAAGSGLGFADSKLPASETTAASKLAAASASGTGALRARWAKLGAREQGLVGTAAALIGAFVLWSVAVQPALRTLREAPALIATRDAQLQQMQRLAAESKELRGAPRVTPTQAMASLRAATESLGANGKLVVAGDRATLTLNNATGDQVRRWLVDARMTSRVRTVEASLNRAGANFSGIVVVALPSGGSSN